MARSSTYHLHDRLLNGRLGPMLLDWTAEGNSAEDIAYELRRHHDIRVSISTVHRWLAIARAEAMEASA